MKLRTACCSVVSMGIMGLVVWGIQDPKEAPGKPRYFKGNLHTHSLWSDGDDFPEMIADWYKAKGYDFLALTEHNVIAVGKRWVDAEKDDTRKKAIVKAQKRFGADWVDLRTEGGKKQVRLKTLAEVKSKIDMPGKFLMISAEEVTHSFQKLPVHMNAINLKEAIKPIDGSSVSETIAVNLRLVDEKRRKSGEPTLSFLNHPNFQWGVNANDMIKAEELRYYEVYNGHPGTNQNGDAKRPSAEKIWDLVLSKRVQSNQGYYLRGLATDDSHNYHVRAMNKPTPGRGWVMVRARELKTEELMAGLESGDFYASTGVLLEDVQVGPKTLAVKIQMQPGVTYKTTFIATLKEGEPGVVVGESDGKEPSYTLTGKELYVRARVDSSKDHPNPSFKDEKESAWTQPLIP